MHPNETELPRHHLATDSTHDKTKNRPRTGNPLTVLRSLFFFFRHG